nr:integrase, catalytic region, zinc finger, CCHC-type, peptidase aspartic, catalytic [Tanacetum cinerariifolium]
VNILKSIDEGPFQMGTYRETIAKGEEGALHLGPERARVYSDLSSRGTKFVGKWNFPTLTNTSLETPLGRVIDLSASSRVIRVGVSSGSESFFQIDKAIRLMLVPRSAKAWKISIPEKSQGIRNLPRSPSFFGSFLRSMAE